MHDALEIGEAGLADDQARFLERADPIAEADLRPLAAGSERSPPRVFTVKHLAADIANHGWIGPHGRKRTEILRLERAKIQPVSLNPRRFAEQAAYFLPSVRPPKRLLKRA